jgi:homoserine dehydrogenase
MRTYKLAFLGFGNVGKALARLLLEKREEIKLRYGIGFEVTGIFTANHGSVIDTRRVDISHALSIERYDSISSNLSSVDAFDFIRKCEADVLFENSPVNYLDGRPAIDHLRLALEIGMHGITANKGPVVHGYQQLSGLAKEKGKHFLFESTVMDGAPIFSLFRNSLPAAQINSIRGVLNSTTNMMLTLMERGNSFEQSVRYCQDIGIAETDPSGDIDGWDAAVKIAALATVLMDAPVKPIEVERKGIRNITLEEIEQSKKVGKRWKLVCSATRYMGGVSTKVSPDLVSPDSPLYAIDGTTSIVQFESDVLGLLSIIEQDPGPHTTAYGLLADFLNAVRL